jgi:biopolymer transport protein ExbB/TolQ
MSRLSARLVTALLAQALGDSLEAVAGGRLAAVVAVFGRTLLSKAVLELLDAIRQYLHRYPHLLEQSEASVRTLVIDRLELGACHGLQALYPT